jgi:hypothetical protein
VRRTVLAILVGLAGAACSVAPRVALSQAPTLRILVQPSSAPFAEVTAGDVSALVPQGWHAELTPSPDDLRMGFVASPRPDVYRMDGSTTGFTATWVDATRVGVPSDFYYLAANGPLLSGLIHSPDCRRVHQRILINHRPAFDAGRPGSPGDYMASGDGTCTGSRGPTRWAYFVAAPGFGPARRIGIPSSGLYVVVAVMPDTSQAEATLKRLISHTSFAGTTVTDFVMVAHQAMRSA